MSRCPLPRCIKTSTCNDRCVSSTTAYFAHPIRTYGSKDESIILKQLSKKYSKVINPADYSAKAKKLSIGKWLDCPDCKRIVMTPFL